MELKSIKKLSLTVNTVILIMVFGLMFFFHLCNVTFLVYFSIPTSMIYVIGYCLIHKNKLNIYVWLVFFWLTFYMGVTTICLGYDYGFHLYCFSMIPTMFVTEYMSYKLKKRSLWAFNVSILIAFFYLLCTGYVASFGPVYEVNSKTASTFFWIFNAMTVFGFLIFYSKYLIYSIIKSEEKLSEIAHSDRLTQLYNRHYMLQQLEAVCEMDKDCFLAMADIDFFKKINDTYGHNAGDEVLKNVSSIIKSECSECIIARWGGEEFLIFSASELSNGKEMLENLRKKIEETIIEFDNHSIHTTVTIGMAIKKSGQTVELWIQEADNKLYTGKNNGRNRVIE
ncbi:MAG: GGDEF domain-containing protein [Ruminococcus sp.]|nr:GGDEF domain-containing protein [Ruminococcus sp.]